MEYSGGDFGWHGTKFDKILSWMVLIFLSLMFVGCVATCVDEFNDPIEFTHGICYKCNISDNQEFCYKDFKIQLNSGQQIFIPGKAIIGIDWSWETNTQSIKAIHTPIGIYKKIEFSQIIKTNKKCPIY